jgi:CHAT domain-containing protein/tetratricopeptide (TPR) repeat protein
MVLSALHYYRGAMPAALEAAEQAERRQDRDSHGQAVSLLLMANVHMVTGEYQSAVRDLEQSLSRYRAAGDIKGEAMALGNLGSVYLNLQDDAKALQALRESLPLKRAQGARRNVRQTLHNIAVALAELGELSAALESYEESLTLDRADEDRLGEAWNLVGIAQVHHLMAQNERAVGELDRALPLTRATGDPQLELFLLMTLADTHRSLGQREKALENYRRAFVLASNVEKPNAQVASLVGAAEVERDRGQLSESLRLVESATLLLERIRDRITSPHLRLSASALIQEVYDVHVDVLMRLHAQNPAGGHERAAFEVSERGRCRRLLEVLQEAKVDLSVGADPALLARERELRAQISAKAMLQAPLHAASEVGDATTGERELAALTRQYDEVQNRIHEQHPRRAALQAPAALAVGELQALLDDETVLIEYHLGAERSYAWAVTRSAFSSAELPKASIIVPLARRLHETLAGPSHRPRVGGAAALEGQRALARADFESAQSAAQLSAMLLAPLGIQKAKRFLIVPDGVLHYVSFAALPVPNAWSADAEPVVVGHEVVTLPSASIGSFLRTEERTRTRAARQIAVFADPVFSGTDGRLRPQAHSGKAQSRRRPDGDGRLGVFGGSADTLNLFREGVRMDSAALPRLDYTRELADLVVEGLPSGDVLKAVDFDASREAVLSRPLAQYRTIVFATHGLLNTQYPELSGIVLSLVNERGEPRDGFLRLHDVYDLKLNAELVVLGACETGLGKEINGEGLVGLSRGFLHAGAARVLASLWKVDEDATIELLKEFFRARKQGRAFPAALQQAQLALRSRPRWRAPYFWAGFTLQGDWK